MSEDLIRGDFDSMQFNEITAPVWYPFYRDYIPELDDDKEKQQLHCLNTENHQSGDKHKSAWIDLYSGVYGCSVCGHFGPARFLSEIVGLDKTEAYTIASQAKQTIFKDRESPIAHLDFTRPPTLPMMQFNADVDEAAKRLSPDLPIVQNYMESRGIAYETLTDWSVGYMPKAPGQQECLVLPYRRNGHVVAVRGRSFSGLKGAMPDSAFIPYGLDRLAGTEFALIVEGETDALTAYQAIKEMGLSTQIAVVGIPGTNAFKKEWARYFAHCRRIFHIPQTDKAAAKLAGKIIEVLGKTRVQIIEIPWDFFDLGKDIADFLHQHTPEEFVRLLPDIGEQRQFLLSTEDIIAEAGGEFNYIVQNLISEREKWVVYGKPKAFKTFFAINMAVAIAKGEPFLESAEWTVPEPRTVLFVEEEGNITKFGRRINLILEGEGTPNAWWVHGQGINVDDDYSLRELRKVLENKKPDVVFFDPFASLHNADENSNSEVKMAWQRLKQLVYSYVPDAVIVLIHHIPKSATDRKLTLMDNRGASFTAGEVDGGIGLRRAYKEEVDEKIVLYASIEGREIASEDEYRVVVDPVTFRMKADGLNVEVSPKESRKHRAKAILNMLADNPYGLTLDEMSMEMDLSTSTLRSTLRALIDKGEIIKDKKDIEGGGRRPTIYLLEDVE